MSRTIMIAREASPEEREVIDRKGGLRLNNDMRAEVVRRAIEHAFGKREKDLTERNNKLAHFAMIESFGAATLKLAGKLGKPWVNVCEDNWGAKSPNGVPTNFRVGPFGKTIALLVKDPVPIGARHDISKYFKVGDPNLVKEIEQLMDDYEALKAEKTKAISTLNALLGSFAAYSTLEKGWPEGKPFYKHIPKDYPFRHQVPAVLVSDLNKTLGI